MSLNHKQLQFDFGGYLYHATNIENASDIYSDGKLKTFRPWHGTDQQTWPDGTKEKRAYFSMNPQTAASFYPEYGQPVMLRIKYVPGVFKKEQYTGDWYSNKPIPADQIELRKNIKDNWIPLNSYFNQK